MEPTAKKGRTTLSLVGFGRSQLTVLGRLFNYHVLDMLEFGVTKFKPLKEFPTLKQNMLGSKPCFAIIGNHLLRVFLID
jgi:hypothetical protein